MPRDYEILFIVRPDLEDEQVAEAVKSVDSLIASFGGTSQKTEMWGRRKLAYEVKHLREGHYALTDFQLETERVPELEGALKISETVFRYLVVRKPEPKAPKGKDGKKIRGAKGAEAAASDASAPEAEAPAAPAPAAEETAAPAEASAPVPEPAAERR